MKTNNKLSAYILRGSTAALLFSCVIVALCSAINLPEQPRKAPPPQDSAGFGSAVITADFDGDGTPTPVVGTPYETADLPTGPHGEIEHHIAIGQIEIQ